MTPPIEGSYGPIRGGGRQITAPQTPVEPITADTDALIVAFTRAFTANTPELVRLVEQRVAMRFESTAKAQESAELTMQKRRAEAAEEEKDKWARRAKQLGLALGFVMVTYTTALAVYRDAVGTAEPVAQEAAAVTATTIAEAKTLPLDARVSEHDARLTALAAEQTEQRKLLEGVVPTIDRMAAWLDAHEQPTRIRVKTKGSK